MLWLLLRFGHSFSEGVDKVIVDFGEVKLLEGEDEIVDGGGDFGGQWRLAAAAREFWGDVGKEKPVGIDKELEGVAGEAAFDGLSRFVLDADPMGSVKAFEVDTFAVTVGTFDAADAAAVVGVVGAKLGEHGGVVRCREVRCDRGV